MIDAAHVHPVVLGGAPLQQFSVGPLSSDEVAYVKCSWLESFHLARGEHRMPFRYWRPETSARMDRVLEQSKAIAARVPDGRIVGWMIWTPGRAISTIHYVFVRFKLDGFEWRRRGVMTALLDAAGIGSRVAYTYKGEYRKSGKWRSINEHHRRGCDEEIVDWLARRGIVAVYEPIKEWMG